MNDELRRQNFQNTIFWSLVGLGVILILFIIFRIVSRYIQQKKLKIISEQNPIIKTGIEILRTALIGVSIPPVLLFKISYETFLNLGYNPDTKQILEQKKWFKYRYYIVDFPCVFYFDIKERQIFKNSIKVDISTELMIANIATTNIP